MAIVTAGFEVSISVADNGANVSTLSWEANTAVVTDFLTAQAQRDNLVADLQAVTDSIVVATRLSEVQYEDSIAYPVAGVENENKASITYLIDGTNDKGNIKIPAPVIDIFVAATGPSANVVDIADPLVVAYTDNFRVTGGWFVSDGQSLITVLKGKRVSAKNNNG
jgi:hypothetical protein